MADKLRTLIRLHRWRLDEQRRQLTEIIGRLTAAEAEQQALEDEVLAEQEAAREHPAEAGIAYGAYAREAIVRREQAVQRVNEAAAAVTAQRDVLQAAWRTLRTFELADEARRQRQRVAAEQRERAMLDEVALIARARADGAARVERDQAEAARDAGAERPGQEARRN